VVVGYHRPPHHFGVTICGYTRVFSITVSLRIDSHIRMDGHRYPVIIIDDVFTRSNKIIISSYVWQYADIVCFEIREDGNNSWDYLIGKEGMIPSLEEFHMAAIKEYKTWYPILIGGTKEMETLHKLLWEV